MGAPPRKPARPAKPQRPARPPRLPARTGVIGAGRVGVTLATALRRAGYQISGAATLSPGNRARVRRLLPGTPILPPDEVATASDLLILAVPDDALAGLVKGLTAAKAIHSGQIVVHTSGAHGLAVLRPAADIGAHPLALHPAMTFTGSARDLARLGNTTFGVTAPPHLKQTATRLVSDLDGVPEWIDEDARTRYHAGLGHGANHLVTLVNDAMDTLRAAGVSDPAKALRPLLRAALDNTLELGDAALTGPVSRGDAGTVAGHLAVLDATVRPVYLALARRTADRAIAAGRLRPADAADLLETLAADQTEDAPA
jgi:predicted short-subunit dehydrogenase-like oxidoreductase (DUF2520 family)